jgi:tetratricopeptide (TPR) repeat protein
LKKIDLGRSRTHLLFPIMKRPQLISPGSLNRMLAGADEAWQRRDFQQSIELLERASRLDPANSRILLHLGRSYGLRYRSADAERCFEKAVRVAPNKAEMLAAAGRMAAETGNHQMAERYFRQALEQKNVAPDTVARLAELYERLRRVEEAAVMVERALHLDNACPLARLTQAKLDRYAGRLAEAEEVLRPVLTAADRELRIRGFYELGAICDRQGRYDDAMSAFVEAKALLLPDAPPLLAQLQLIIGFLKEMQNNVSAAMLARWSDSGQELLQPPHRLAFLGGHARSGTTLLEQVLDSHPDIVSAEETQNFHDDAYTPLRRNLPPETTMLAGLDGASIQTLRQARERYFQSMSLGLGGSPGQRLLIDKNPSLQAFILAFVRFFPEARLIVALRDPRDVVLSCFMQPHWPISAASVNYLNLADTATAYSRTMGIWRTLQPLIKNPRLEVRYEDMVEDLESVARRTLDFLGVAWDERVLRFDEHARQKLVRSPTYADVTQPVYKRARGRWRNYRKYLEPHLEKLEPFVKAFGYE